MNDQAVVKGLLSFFENYHLIKKERKLAFLCLFSSECYDAWYDTQVITKVSIFLHRIHT